jgi:autotransporter-associated beta strand protein
MPDWLASTNATWTDSANWNPYVPFLPGESANFNFSHNAINYLIGIPGFANIALGSLTANLSGTGGMAITGSMTFNNRGSSANVTINTGPSNALFAMTGNLILADDTVWNITNANGVADISGTISGSKLLSKTGPGTLKLDVTNSVTGDIHILGGTLEAASDASLGSGAILLSQFGALRSSGVVDNEIRTVIDAQLSTGSGTLLAASGNTMTLTGVLSHLSRGTVVFGSATDTGTIVASFANIFENAAESGFEIRGGTLRIGNSFNAANLFNHPGSGLTKFVSGGILDTRGFAAVVSNLDFDSGTIRATLGALNLTVNDSTASGANIAQTGTIEGTAGFDQIIVNALNDFSLADINWVNWTTASDSIFVSGSANANILTGSNQRDELQGLGGNDVLNGNGNIDLLNGGDGNDTINLTAGNSGSVVIGGNGTDRLVLTNGGIISLGLLSGIEELSLNGNANLILTGAQFANGLSQNALLLSTGIGTIVVTLSPGNQQMISKLMTVQAGSDIRITVNGSSGADIVKLGNGATHTVFGGAGTDIIQGGNLADRLIGDGDIDKIAGNGGADILTGGAGADVFKFRNVSDAGTTAATRETITDFVIGSDRLNFLRIDANAALAGDQAFLFNGTGAFVANGQGQIRYQNFGADLLVVVDANGDTFADMHVLLQGLNGRTLTAADFVL